ncbi:MAG: response regulator [Acidobacteria bacterium]|nr:response regulator [Acidobacteriota bacterium]
MNVLQNPTHSTRILVVDDEALTRRALVAILHKAGYDCLEAEGTDEALSLLEKMPPELVLADIQMPGRSGLDLVKAMADRIPEVSVVMVTGVDDANVATECLGLGAYGYVIKPILPNAILIAVANALRRRMLEIEHRDREAILARKVREQTLELRASREEIAWRLLAASEHRDTETGAHIRRIGLYAAAMGRLLGWDPDRIESLQAAAPMHDIGKIGIPDRILQKPGPLTEDEWRVMRTHAATGAAILQDSEVPFISMGARIAVCHHERWDGSGYPAGLRNEQIPLEARITCLVDVYDALNNHRCYHQAWPEEKALAYMKGKRGEIFDPVLADLFFTHYETFQNILRTNPDAPMPPFKAARTGQA